MIKSKELINRDVLKEFFNPNNIKSIKLYGNGHINQTYLVTFSNCKYIIQKINHHVFKNPFLVMKNIKLVTNHITKKVLYEGKNPYDYVLSYILTRDDKMLAVVNNEYWRCMKFIEKGITYENVPNNAIFEEVGRCVGEFQRLLEDFEVHYLEDTITNFHNTPYRYNRLIDIIKVNKYLRRSLCEKEIEFVIENKNKINVIVNLLENGSIPYRVCHNDTKLNNIMISKSTNKALCLIDLDTTMKGSLLYDYGDALRLGASNAAEDESDLEKVTINFELFKSFSSGYLNELKGVITEMEIRHLLDGYFIMCFECGIRFLTDFIDGDQYFVIKEEEKSLRPYLNLERARNQFKLTNEILINKCKLISILNEILEKNMYNILL